MRSIAMFKAEFGRNLKLLAVVLMALSAGNLAGQTGAPQAGPTSNNPASSPASSPSPGNEAIGSGPGPVPTSGPMPAFDVSSVKPSKEGTGGFRIMFIPDGISMQGIPVQMLLHEAFGIEDDRILGAPGWVATTRYDVEAKVEPADAPRLDKATRDERRQMLIPLLADRFGLKFHHETRELPVYALVVAKGGVKMKETKPDELNTAPPTGAQPGQPGPPPRRMMRMNGRGSLEGTGIKTDFIATMLSQQLSRTVFDKTGLKGTYDFTLQWTPDDAAPMGMPMGGGPVGGGNAAPPDSVGPSLFTAVQEQLGLKLEPAKGPVDVIVIDHIEAPTAN